MFMKMLRGEVASSSSKAKQTYDFDLFIIGAGCGGVRAARVSRATYGAKVGMCELPLGAISTDETGGVGGTCILRGCIPKMILLYGASYRSEFEDVRSYGWEVNDIDFDCKKLMENKATEVMRLNNIYEKLLLHYGVKLYEGEGRIVGPNLVEVRQIDTDTKKCFSAKHILVATGSRASRPNIPGRELGITSDSALSLSHVPKRAVILGGGCIAVEFASIWRAMGAAVDICFKEELPLRGFDDEMRIVVKKNLEARDVVMHPRTKVTRLINTENGIRVCTDHREEMMADVVLFATGRIPNTHRLNLEAARVELDKTGAIEVNEYSRTNIPSIWAVGDVTNRRNLTPVALMEGGCVAKTIFGGQLCKPDYKNIPTAVFCIPPLSVVGLTEEQAVRETKDDILVYTSVFNPLKNVISGRVEKTVMKLVVDEETDKVLGASMCGPDSPEIMQGIAVALKCGATKAQFDSTVGIHPTAAEEFVTMRSLTRRISK